MEIQSDEGLDNGPEVVQAQPAAPNIVENPARPVMLNGGEEAEIVAEEEEREDLVANGSEARVAVAVEGAQGADEEEVEADNEEVEDIVHDAFGFLDGEETENAAQQADVNGTGGDDDAEGNKEYEGMPILVDQRVERGGDEAEVVAPNALALIEEADGDQMEVDEVVEEIVQAAHVEEMPTAPNAPALIQGAPIVEEMVQEFGDLAVRPIKRRHSDSEDDSNLPSTSSNQPPAKKKKVEKEKEKEVKIEIKEEEKAEEPPAHHVTLHSAFGPHPAMLQIQVPLQQPVLLPPALLQQQPALLQQLDDGQDPALIQALLQPPVLLQIKALMQQPALLRIQALRPQPALLQQPAPAQPSPRRYKYVCNICAKPTTYSSVQCTICGKWVHWTCAGFTDTPKEGFPFPNCSTHRK